MDPAGFPAPPSRPPSSAAKVQTPSAGDNPLLAALRDPDGLCHRWLLPPLRLDGANLCVGGSGGGYDNAAIAAATVEAYHTKPISREGLGAAGTLTGKMRYWIPVPEGWEQGGGKGEHRSDETGAHVSFLVRLSRGVRRG